MSDKIIYNIYKVRNNQVFKVGGATDDIKLIPELIKEYYYTVNHFPIHEIRVSNDNSRATLIYLNDKTNARVAEHYQIVEETLISAEKKGEPFRGIAVLVTLLLICIFDSLHSSESYFTIGICASVIVYCIITVIRDLIQMFREAK
jgi:hypothetical protein